MTEINVGEIVQLIKTEKMAVVKYIGSTNFKSGIWYGLCLDGPDGTHDGIVEGTRYFTCPANHGKMVQGRAIQSGLFGRLHAYKTCRKTIALPFCACGLFGINPASFLREYVRVCAIQQGQFHVDHTLVHNNTVEKTIFRKPARVFSFNAEQSAWTEKGTGAFTLRQSTRPDKRARIYMKKDNNSSINLVDHPINPKTQLEKSRGSNTAWVYKVRKHSVNKGEDEVLAVQFGSADVAMEFHRLHSTCCADMTKAPSPAKIAAAAAPKVGNAHKVKAKRRLTIDGVNNKIDLSLLKKGMEDMGISNELADDSHEATAVATATNIGVISQNGISTKGYAADPRTKPFNQDALVHVQDAKTGAWLFAVFDGHGEVGHDVSGFIQKQFAVLVFSHSQFPAKPAVAMREVISAIEDRLLETVDCRLSGTTAVMCVIHNGLITCANIGDSRLVIGTTVDGKIVSKDISHDHKPDLPAEKRRIESNGGRVFAIDYGDDLPSPARVWLRDAQLPGLAMSRSVGDTVGKAAGVISTPEITTHVLTENDLFCIIASDGLWEFIESDEAVQMVSKHEPPIKALDKCMAESRRRWLMHEVVTDDTTVCIMQLGDLNKLAKS